MHRSVVFATPHLGPLRELACMAERLGFHRAWTTDYTDRDALIRCALIGAATTTLQVGTGIAYSFTRHPVALAAAAADIHEATRGRFSLGLGAATGGMRSRWFGIDDARPVSRMREAVELLRQLWASESSVSFEGAYFTVHVDGLHQAGRLRGMPPLRVFGSGLNEKMLTAASQWCDGVLLHPLAVSERGQDKVRAIVGGADRAGAPRPLQLSQWVITSVAPDREAAREVARRSLAFYLSTRSYAGHFAGTPWESVPQTVSDAFRAEGPRWESLAVHVPDAMVDDYCIAGTPSEARGRARAIEERLARTGVAELVLQVATTDQDPGATTASFSHALDALAPDA
jgi:alkanesulfonate monooxygenase SsuD/methylene tetrahydromethanopterin reductase-like flavin-dependent oxidoreductase (luciferase family)